MTLAGVGPSAFLEMAGGDGCGLVERWPSRVTIADREGLQLWSTNRILFGTKVHARIG